MFSPVSAPEASCVLWDYRLICEVSDSVHIPYTFLRRPQRVAPIKFIEHIVITLSNNHILLPELAVAPGCFVPTIVKYL